MKIIATLAVAGLMASGASGIVAAAVASQEAGAHAFAAIDLHDINLQTRAGEEVLKRRLKDSVKQQCRAFSNQAAGGFARRIPACSWLSGEGVFHRQRGVVSVTMANLIVQHDRAYLMTDSGYFRGDGTIATLGPKSMTIPGLPVAIAMIGAFHLGHLAAQIEKEAFSDTSDFLRKLGPLLMDAYVAAKMDPDESWARVLVGFYSHEHGRAHGCTLFSSSIAGARSLRTLEDSSAAEGDYTRGKRARGVRLGSGPGRVRSQA